MKGTRTPILRHAKIPDPLRLARFQRTPELGPRILFFSGGSALKGLSKKIIHYTHNSTHLITAFDSGGSSAKIREAFSMLAVGDLRNRLMALADQSVKGNPAIYRLFATRLPEDMAASELNHKLVGFIQGEDPLMKEVPNPMRKIIQNHLHYFYKDMPLNFDLRGASLGNLVLTGGFLMQDRDIDPVLFNFSKLVEVRGIVHPIVEGDHNLVARLSSGKIVVGQHQLTGKEVDPLGQKIEDIFISAMSSPTEEMNVAINEKVKRLIGEAELIVFPMGSFYSSLLCNLLPKGVGKAIYSNPCPKVFIPNTGNDPEQYGLTLEGSLDKILSTLKNDLKEDVMDNQFITHVLLDSELSRYQIENTQFFSSRNITPIQTDLVQKGDYLDSDLVCQVLLSMI